MISLRFGQFLSPALRNICVSQVHVRNYAKGKDKKKEKNPKKTGKVEIHDDQIGQVVNVEQLRAQMQKTLDIMQDEYVKNLSVRSTTGAIETMKVNYDGKEHELQELAQIVRKNPKTIVVNMISFPQTIPNVLQAIQKSGMNLNPQQEGTTIYIPVPKVTKEHRENLSKNAKSLFIKCRDHIKDIQNQNIKKVKKNSDISQDLNHQIQEQITAIAKNFVTEAEKLMETKQKELSLGDK